MPDSDWRCLETSRQSFIISFSLSKIILDLTERYKIYFTSLDLIMKKDVF